MKTAREVAEELVEGLVTFGQSIAGRERNVDRLTAAIEQDRREVIEACAKAVEAERLLEPDEDDGGDEAYQHAVNHCARAVRSLSSTPATKEVTRG